MRLLTKEIEKKLARNPLGSQDGKGKDADIICKFFTPDSSFTWLVLEGEQEGDDWLLYGLVDGLFGWEYGYFSLNELKSIRGNLGLPVERDMYFGKCKVGDVVKR